MFKTRYKIISFFLIMSIVMSFATLSVNAGTLSSNGSGGGGSNTGSDDDDRYMYNCFIDWSKVSQASVAYADRFENITGGYSDKPSWTHWYSGVTGETDRHIWLGELDSDIAKWSAVIKYTNNSIDYYDDWHFLWHGRQGAPWKFFRWSWWYEKAHFDDPDEIASEDGWGFSGGLDNGLKNSSGKYVTNNYYPDTYTPTIWMNGIDIPDADLVKAANKDSFYRNPYYHMWKKADSVGGQKLDIVWVDKSALETPKSETKTVLIQTSGSDSDYNYTSKDAEWLWEKCPTERTYSGKSAENQYNYTKKVSGKICVITHTWTEVGGSKKSGTDKYKKGSVTNLKQRELNYKVTTPSVDIQRFNALDLNRNGNALANDVKTDFGYTPASGKNLKASVDNGLGITNGAAIPALDSNNVAPFQITFKNSQFGIPTAAQGGYDIATNSSGIAPVKNGGVYNISASFASGSTNQQLSVWTEKLGGTKQTAISSGKAGKSKVSSRTQYWTGSNLQLQAYTNQPNSSLIYNNHEYTYKQGESAKKVPITANVSATASSPQTETVKFRSIKSGEYKLSNNNSKNWWTVSYQGGKLYTYGVEFSGKITVSGVGTPTIKSHDFYVGTASTTTIQPILKGKFDVKSVGGDS